MDIIYLGLSSFKLSGKNASIVIDPFDPQMVGIPYKKQEADIVLVSHDHADHNNVSAISSENAKIINSPGEYEIKGVSIFGYKTYHDDKKGAERGVNTVYLINIDGINIAHLGDLGHPLSEKIIEQLGSVDVLMIPVGTHYTMSTQTALSVMQNIEPSIVIPMHYKMEGMGEAFSEILDEKEFLAQSGLRVEQTNKLTLKEGQSFVDQYIALLPKQS